MSDAGSIDYPLRLREALAALIARDAEIDRLRQQHRVPIAVVGIGCRFPGGGAGPEAFWQQLAAGRDAIRPIPEDRWSSDELYHPDPDRPGKLYTRSGGFLDAVDRFDARFFRISRREAESMDPQQRLLLEVTWEALEHGGIVPADLMGSRTGVFVGLTVNDYARLLVRGQLDRIDAYTATGNVANIAAGRISYFLGLTGPSLALDTACSSSLVAVHLACQSLRLGESDMAIAAGVNLILTPDNSVAVARAHMLSPGGRCRAFDASADGYARSEGCGVVVLKTLSRAERDQDRILATVRGSAVLQDGARSGLTVPNGVAQQAVMRQALGDAGLEPHQVGYIEAHGTGTALGDPIEMEALASVYGGRRERSKLFVGSLKTNLGHMESAAGIGGLIKAVLVAQRGAIPKHLHLERVNPAIDLDAIPAALPQRMEPWPEPGPRRVGVSSFGSSGTIAHVLVESPPPLAAAAPVVPSSAVLDRTLVLSAPALPALAAQCRELASWLEARPDVELGAVCHETRSGRTRFAHTIAVAAPSVSEACRELRRMALEIDAGSLPASANGSLPPELPRCPRRGIPLPTYPFQRERYWVAEPAASAPAPALASRPRFGIMFFNGSEDPFAPDKYRFLLEAARFADRNGLASVWLPERHFTGFGGLYPNPATLHAALARETTRVRLMAGSVVLPLHHPLRVAEEWSVVDNLSGGRVGMSFASGWNPDDFALDPQAYAARHDRLFEALEELRRLWRGEAVPATSGTRQDIKVRIFPTPLQPELPAWVTAAGNPRTFERAGSAGAHLLTHLLDQDVEELAGKIALYRSARAARGLDPMQGQVTVMLHTFLGPDLEQVREKVRSPYCRYIRDNIHLLSGLAASRGGAIDPAAMSPEDLDTFVSFLFERFFATRALLGTPASCRELVQRLGCAGVDEIACLLDFGPPAEDVLPSLPLLLELRAAFTTGQPLADPAPIARTGRPAEAIRGLHRVDWPVVELPEVSGGEALPRSWLVFGEGGEFATALAARLTGLGHRVTTVEPSRPIERGCCAPMDTVVWLRDLDRRGADPADPTLGMLAPVELARELSGQDSHARLWLMTRSGQQLEGDAAPAPAQAALAALCRVLPIEQPGNWGGVLDLERNTSPLLAAEMLVRAASGSGEDWLAVRGGRARAARLLEDDTTMPLSTPFRADPDASYLVTGGFGGLGQVAARWLVSRGARALVLLGRSRKVVDIAGATVTTAALDVADAAALEAWLESPRNSGLPPVRGVIHCAGVWRDRPLSALDRDDLAAVLRPKALGIESLSRCFPPGSLGLFVGFSAFSAILPAAGQGNYAAANAWLDAAVAERRAAGERAITIDWGPWSGVGFAASATGASAHLRLESLGIERFTPEQGLLELGRLVDLDRPRAALMKVDWKRLFSADPDARLAPLLSGLSARHAPKPAAGHLPLDLAALSSPDQLAAIEGELAELVAEVVRVPRSEVGRDLAFSDLGVDSLMAVEIKNRILARTGASIPLARLLDGPSLADLAPQVLAAIKVRAVAASEPGHPDSPPGAPGMQEILL